MLLKICKVSHPEIYDTLSDLALTGIFPVDVEMSQEYRLILKPYVKPKITYAESFLCLICFFLFCFFCFVFFSLSLNLSIPIANGRVILFVTENDIVNKKEVKQNKLKGTDTIKRATT